MCTQSSYDLHSMDLLREFYTDNEESLRSLSSVELDLFVEIEEKFGPKQRYVAARRSAFYSFLLLSLSLRTDVEISLFLSLCVYFVCLSVCLGVRVCVHVHVRACVHSIVSVLLCASNLSFMASIMKCQNAAVPANQYYFLQKLLREKPHLLLRLVVSLPSLFSPTFFFTLS